jgi:hypothetical protein
MTFVRRFSLWPEHQILLLLLTAAVLPLSTKIW